ncbi:hypothetical protein A8135_13715 [Legionella jamestowniensis]|uniref:O-antigen acetylase n=1 Tax=Legionella jamestowniensis TaxID=455 RepID=A0ABX2Y037_9GAMM|nr:acyltransferase family protein [Legionella jamestowniensis]OCH97550.1 hypothetical protein A8135_13715 [Legionella jamestowniensis]
MMNRSAVYRPDIDGLRAVAVLAVTIFHFNKGWLPGGFTGVDIFFVISGFFITGIIQRQIIKNEFLLSEFYFHRIKRIFPATFFVILVSLVVGAIFMLPTDNKQLSDSAIAALFSGANVYYWLFLDISYFAPSSDTIPLLHLWSLGVEEQFYLLWPALVLITYKSGGKHLVLAVSVFLSIVSFSFSQYWLSRDAWFAYYMLPSRAGELLVGGIVSLLINEIKKTFSLWFREIVGWIGFCLIILSFFFITEATDFPGYVALIPTSGTALLIIAGTLGKTSVIRMLSLKPLVNCGLISFSLYLWHWPILAFYRYGYGDPNFWGGCICVTLIIILTLFSYFFIEKKFRYAKHMYIPQAASIALFSIILISAVYFHKSGGYLNHKTAKEFLLASRKIKSQITAASHFNYNCQVDEYNAKLLKDKRCILGKKIEPKILMWGDSHSAHYVGYMKQVAEYFNLSIRNISHSSCLPFFEGSERYVRKARASCSKFNNLIKDSISKYDVLIVGASWGAYQKKNYKKDLAFFISQLAKTNKKVLIALDVPWFPKYNILCELKSYKIPYTNCKKTSEYYQKEDTDINRFIVLTTKKYKNVSTFSLRDVICKNNLCSAYFNGKPIYFDKAHLNMAGSIMLGSNAIKTGSIPKNLLRALNIGVTNTA